MIEAINNNCYGKLYDISIPFLTYNQNWEKIRRSFDSVFMQKGIKYQIVVTDDGSECNWFKEMEEYFRYKHFVDYKLISHEENQGTVKNFLDGVLACDSEYIRPLGPGDMLYGDDILKNWLESAKKANSDISFSDSVYFRNSDAGKIEIVSVFAYPQRVDYYKNSGEKFRKDYLLNYDICVGVGMLCRKSLLVKYLREVSDRIIYAEDQLYRLAIYDRVKTNWFDEKSMLYEWGEGTSTCNGKTQASKRLGKDIEIADEMLRERVVKSHGTATLKDKIFNRQLLRTLRHRFAGESALTKHLHAWIVYITVPFAMSNRIHRLVYGMRCTPQDVKNDFLEKMGLEIK